MIIESEVLHDWAVAATGLNPDNVVRQDQRIGQRSGISCYYTVPSVVLMDHTHAVKVGRDESDVDFIYRNRATITTSFNIQAPRAKDYAQASLLAQNLSIFKRTFASREVLRPKGLAASLVSGPRDLTGVGDVENSPRFQIDVNFYGWVVYTELRERIKSMSLGYTIGNETGTIEIPELGSGQKN